MRSVRTLALVVAAAAVPLAVASGSAAAQPGLTPPGAAPPAPAYYPPPPPPPPAPPARGGLVLGFGIGLGSMSVDGESLECPSCEAEPPAFVGDLRIGYALSPRLALSFVVVGAAKTIEDSSVSGFTASLGSGVVAARYWATPRLWVEGGLGSSTLTLVYEDRFEGGVEYEYQLERGATLLLGLGYELASSPRFALDLHARLVAAGFEDAAFADSTDGSTVSTATLGLGFHWYGIGR